MATYGFFQVDGVVLSSAHDFVVFDSRHSKMKRKVGLLLVIQLSQRKLNESRMCAV